MIHVFLSAQEKFHWAQYAKEIAQNGASPAIYEPKIRRNLFPAFCFYIGTLLAARGEDRPGIEWLEAGAKREEAGMSTSAFLLGFLQRHQGKMIKPVVVFEDRRPFVHFSHVPMMKKIRKQLVHQCTHSLPSFGTPVRIMDIGCGDGGLTVMFLSGLVETGKANRISEIHLVDPSPAMIELAKKKSLMPSPASPSLRRMHVSRTALLAFASITISFFPRLPIIICPSKTNGFILPGSDRGSIISSFLRWMQIMIHPDCIHRILHYPCTSPMAG